MLSFLNVLMMYRSQLKISSRCSPVPFFLLVLGVVILEVVIETVTNARNGEDQARMLGVRLNFPAQLCHIDMQAMHPGVRVCPPTPRRATFASSASFLYT